MIVFETHKVSLKKNVRDVTPVLTVRKTLIMTTVERLPEIYAC